MTDQKIIAQNELNSMRRARKCAFLIIHRRWFQSTACIFIHSINSMVNDTNGLSPLLFRYYPFQHRHFTLLSDLISKDNDPFIIHKTYFSF